MLKSFLNKLPLALLVCVFLVAVLSWVGNVYGWQCRNMLSADGLRWWLARFMTILNETPWIHILLGTSAFGVLMESGMIQGIKQKKSLKQKRAFTFVVAIVLLMIVVVSVVIALPGNQFLSAFGTFYNSPLQKGLFPLVALAVILIAGVYGYASGRFLNLRDFSAALVWLPKKIAEYFITLFVAAQLLAVLTFSFFLDYVPGSPLPDFIVLMQWFLYAVPLGLYIYLCFEK